MGNDHSTVIERLAETYPQLYLDPDKADIEEYKACVRKGERPAECGLSHFVTDERDCAETVETPAGTAEVITLYNRHDFEVFVRCMMAARKGPLDQIPATMGAATIVAFNWPKINAHRKAFMEEQRDAGVLFPDWNAEFKRFTAVKANYQDLLIVLSRGPYSNVTAAQVSECLTADGRSPVSEDEWIRMSGDIRKYHELTHFVCRNLYPDKIDEIWDELVADAVGIYGATGEYSVSLEELFLGITDGATATANTFLSWQTIKIIVLGVIAFSVGTSGGLLLAKLMNKLSGGKINPLIGSAGVSAVPMAARVSQRVGQQENPGNFLLMHAMGPNVAGVIGSAIAAGVLLSMFG